MKTFDEAISEMLYESSGVMKTRPMMDRYGTLGAEILNDNKAIAVAKYFLEAAIVGEIGMADAIRFAFCQGVLCGIEMEKSD